MLIYVTFVKKVEGLYLHSGISGKGHTLFKHEKEFKPGSWLDVKGAVQRFDEDTIEIIPGEIEFAIELNKKEEKEINGFIEKQSHLHSSKFFINDETMKMLLPKIEEAASFIKKAAALKRPIIVRYDSDQDGLTSALSLYYALSGYYNIKFVQQMFPFYSKMDLDDDKRYIDRLESSHLSPVLVCVDFGSNPESEKAYRLAVENGFSIVVIDHHPPHKPSIGELIDVWVSAWLVDSKMPSAYTAGLLSSEVAKKISKLDNKLAERLVKVSLTSDRSKIWTPSKEDLKYAEAVGYYMGTAAYENSISQYAKAFNDEEMLDFAYAQSEEKIQVFIEKISKHVKSKASNGINFYLADVSKIVRKGSYPNKGLASNIVGDLYGNKEFPAVTMVFTGRNISLRANKQALALGLDFSSAIKQLKKDMGPVVETGGGHKMAAALRIRNGYLRETLSNLIRIISSQNKSAKA